MSKMGMEFDRKLDEAKYDMYETLKLFIERKQGFNYPIEFELPMVRAEQALARVEK